MKTILDIVNASTGRNSATDDKFPRRIMHGKYDAGFAAKLSTSRDVRLYLENARAAGIADEVAEHRGRRVGEDERRSPRCRYYRDVSLHAERAAAVGRAATIPGARSDARAGTAFDQPFAGLIASFEGLGQRAATSGKTSAIKRRVWPMTSAPSAPAAAAQVWLCRRRCTRQGGRGWCSASPMAK